MALREVAVLLIGLAAAGCGTAQMYDGAGRAPGEVAEIGPKSILYSVKIESIDGKETPAFDRAATILPGTHTVHVTAFASDETGTNRQEWSADLCFNAVAGHRYSVVAALKELKGWLWIEDNADRSLVAGSKPE